MKASRVVKLREIMLIRVYHVNCVNRASLSFRARGNPRINTLILGNSRRASFPTSPRSRWWIHNTVSSRDEINFERIWTAWQKFEAGAIRSLARAKEREAARERK